MTFFEWANKHAANIGKKFEISEFKSQFDLNSEMTYPPTPDQLHFVMLVNKHIQHR